MLGVELASVHVVEAARPSQDNMPCMNLGNRVIPPAHSKDVLDIFFIGECICVYLWPLADVRNVVTPWTVLCEGQAWGMREGEITHPEPF